MRYNGFKEANQEVGAERKSDVPSWFKDEGWLDKGQELPPAQRARNALDGHYNGREN